MLANPFIYSSEQAEILMRLGSLTNITYKDERLASHTIALSVYNELAKGKANIIVTQNAEIKQMIWESLRDIGLHHLALECKLMDPLLDSDIEGWREWLQTKNLGVHDEYENIKFKFEILDRSIKSYYVKQSKVESNQFDPDRVLEKYWLLHSHESLERLLVELKVDGIDFDLPTYKLLVSQLEEATFYFQQNFELIDTKPYAEILNKTNGVINDIHDTSYTLFGFQERVKGIYNQYTSLILEIKESYQQQLLKQLADITQSVDFIIHKTDIVKSKLHQAKQHKSFVDLWRKDVSGVSMLKANIEKDLQEIVEFFIKNKCGNPDITYETLISDDLSWVSKLTTKIKVFEDSIPQKVTDYLKSVNKLNISNNTLQALETEFNVLIANINEANIFDKKIELNTLSLLKQFDSISQLSKELKIKALHIDINLPYYQWLHKLSEFDVRTVAVIDVLRHYEVDEWLGIFNRWFYHQVLYMQIYHLHHINTSQLDEASILHIQYHELEKAKVLNRMHQLPDEKEKRSLKTHFPSLYQGIYKSSKLKDRVVWKQVIEYATSFLMRKYPILILDSDELSQLDTDAYSNIFYIGVDHIKPDLLQFFTSIHTYISYNRQDKIKTDLTLSTAALTETSALGELSSSNRIGFTRKLTSILLSLDNNPKIFQLRRNGLIFFGKEFIARRIEKELYHYGIKQVIVDDSIEETLLATWLSSDHQPIIIIENHLINSDNADDYLWQRQVIDFLKLHGILVLDLHINKKWQRGVSDVVDHVIKTIKDANTPHREIKNQLSIEF